MIASWDRRVLSLSVNLTHHLTAAVNVHDCSFIPQINIIRQQHDRAVSIYTPAQFTHLHSWHISYTLMTCPNRKITLVSL